MAITKTLIFTGVEITEPTTPTPTVTDYSLHLVDSAEVTVEPVNDTIDDGQTLTAAWDVSFSFKIYDDAITTNGGIYKDATATPVKVQIRFTGASGGATLTVTNVICNATPQFDENRVSYLITGTKRVTTLANAVTVT
jgi:hypothetical protein